MYIYTSDQAHGFRFSRETWGAFTNFQPLPVPIAAGPWIFKSSEHLYQAAKFASRPDMQQRIAQTPTAREAAAIGRTPGLGIVPSCNAQRVDVMRWVLRMKRAANRAEIDAVLTATAPSWGSPSWSQPLSLRINAWSGRLYDRQASNHVAAHHDASASTGRYNKRLLPKAAFAALTATMSAARSTHYDQSLPWDDQGSRLLTVANYERYTELLNALRERVVRERARFIEDYDDYIDQSRMDLGRLFRIEDYPSKETLQGKVRGPLPDRARPRRGPLHG